MTITKIGPADHRDSVQPEIGLRWRQDSEKVWVAHSRGRDYYIEQRMSGSPAEFVAYDPRWPGRAVDCESFPAAVMAAQALADGIEGDPTQHELELAATIAIAALAKQLVGTGRFYFHTLGQIGDGTVAMFQTQLESSWPQQETNFADLRPAKRTREHLKLIRDND